MAIPTAEATAASTGAAGGMSSMLGPLSAAIGPLMNSIIGGLNWKNPADAGMGYLNQISGAISPYYNPYIKAGRGALGTNMYEYGKLIHDPAAMMNKFGQGFQQSPGYQYQVDQATNSANQAAAAGGMVGSPAEQQELSQNIMGMANQDYYNYLNHVLKMFQGGMKGMGDISQTGFQASNAMADDLVKSLMAQSMMAYMGQMAQNQSSGGMLGGITSSLGF
jgi:hypothetical protein